MGNTQDDYLVTWKGYGVNMPWLILNYSPSTWLE